MKQGLQNAREHHELVEWAALFQHTENGYSHLPTRPFDAPNQQKEREQTEQKPNKEQMPIGAAARLPMHTF